MNDDQLQTKLEIMEAALKEHTKMLAVIMTLVTGVNARLDTAMSMQHEVLAKLGMSREEAEAKELAALAVAFADSRKETDQIRDSADSAPSTSQSDLGLN